MFQDLMEFFAPFFLIGAVLIFVVTGLAVGLEMLDCSGFARGTGYETRWAWGCYAKVGNEWVPKDYVFGKAQELRLKAK